MKKGNMKQSQIDKMQVARAKNKGKKTFTIDDKTGKPIVDVSRTKGDISVIIRKVKKVMKKLGKEEEFKKAFEDFSNAKHQSSYYGDLT